MRGVMIAVGMALIERVQWMLYCFRRVPRFYRHQNDFRRQQTVDPEKNPILRLARKIFPVSPDFDGQKFLTRLNGRWPSRRSRWCCSWWKPPI